MVRKQREDESEVTFSVKELFTETKNSVAALNIKIDTLQNMFRDQERHGCGPAQEALTRMVGIVERVGKLETDSVSSRAVKEVQERADSADKTSRLQWYVIGATFLLVVATFFAPFFQHK